MGTYFSQIRRFGKLESDLTQGGIDVKSKISVLGVVLGFLLMAKTELSHAAIVEQMETGSATVASGSTTNTITTTNTYSCRRTFIVYSSTTGSGNTNTGFVGIRPYLNASSTYCDSGGATTFDRVTFTRSASAADTTVQYSIVQFKSGVNVYWGSVTINGTTTGTSSNFASNVDTAKSFVIHSATTGSTASGTPTLPQPSLATSNVTFTTGANGSSFTIYFQVIEYVDSSVQVSTNVSIASSGSSGTATITAIDSTKTIFVFGCKQSGNNDDASFAAIVASASGTTLTLTRTSTAAKSHTCTVYTVTFTDDTLVAAYNPSLNSASSANQAITSVDTNRSIIIQNANNMLFSGVTNNTASPLANAMYKLSFTNSTTVAVARNTTNGNATNMKFFVVTFPRRIVVTQNEKRPAFSKKGALKERALPSP